MNVWMRDAEDETRLFWHRYSEYDYDLEGDCEVTDQEPCVFLILRPIPDKNGMVSDLIVVYVVKDGTRYGAGVCTGYYVIGGDGTPPREDVKCATRIGKRLLEEAGMLKPIECD